MFISKMTCNHFLIIVMTIEVVLQVEMMNTFNFILHKAIFQELRVTRDQLSFLFFLVHTFYVQQLSFFSHNPHFVFDAPMPHSICTLKPRCICIMINIWCQPLTLFLTHNKHFFIHTSWSFQKVLKTFIPMGEILTLQSIHTRVPQDVHILIRTKVLGVYMQMNM